MTFRAIVNADLFRRVSICASTEETRYYLNGVYMHACDQGGVVMVATNGHVLVIIRDSEGVIEGGDAIVRLNKAMLSACKGKPKKPEGGPRKLVIDGQAAKVNTDASGFPFGPPDGDGTIAYQWANTLIDGTFPDYTRIIPNNAGPSTASPGFNPDYVGLLAEALGNSGIDGLKIVAGADDRSAALVFGASGLIDGFGVIMPMRVDNGSVLPAWVPRRAEVQAA